MLKEFKEFALKGNALDMAVGIIIGAAFGGIVQSLVKDIIMPPVGVLTGGIDFTNKFLILKSGADGAAGYATLAEAAKAGAVTINYGTFLTLLINFIIVAVAVFMLVKSFNKLQMEKPPAPTAAPSKEEILLTEIRDILKARA